MFFKLALSNVKKSIRDYLVYFLTLTFGICVFYVFNSVESQQAMMRLTESQKEVMEVLTTMIGGVSVFVSVILGFLIIYANRFLIKRRKKELGIYMTLGMEKGRISKILILETLIIGVASLAAGLALGVFISQGLSVVTAKMFEADLNSFIFVFSKAALLKSVLYFGIIYFIAMIFNTLAISRYQLIDLLNADKKTETLKVKRLWISVVLFIISAVSLAIAYKLILENGLLMADAKFYWSIALGCIGTFLFFMSLSGFLLRMVQTNKRLYFKNLNMFVLRQLNSKINTTFISMTLICLMLLCTIGALSAGISMSDVLSKQLDLAAPFDATLVNRGDFDSGEVPEVLSKLQKDGVPFNTLAKEYSETMIYETNVTYRDILPSDTPEMRMLDVKVPCAKVSEYNRLLKMQGKEEIQLKPGSYVINCNYNETMDMLREKLRDGGAITVNGKTYVPLTMEPVVATMENGAFPMDPGTVILPDEELTGQKNIARIVNIMYPESNGENEQAFRSALQSIYGENGESAPYLFSMTKLETKEQAASLTVVVSYLALYIGIIFLMTSAAVLALQQLSEASDNTGRYGLLRKLGAEEKMISRALFLQILVYFMVPLSLAIVHSIFGIIVVNNVVMQFGKVDILSNLLIVSLFLLLIYGGYFLATYFGSRSMLRPRKS